MLLPGHGRGEGPAHEHEIRWPDTRHLVGQVEAVTLGELGPRWARAPAYLALVTGPRRMGASVTPRAQTWKRGLHAK